MKVECLKDKLAAAVSKIERASGRHSNLPILSCILLEAEDSVLNLSATNLELGVKMSLTAKVIKKGKAAVPGAILSGLIANLSESKNLKLELEDEKLILSAERNRSTILTKKTDEFPIIPQAQGPKFSLASQNFVRALRSVWYSAANSSAKPELSSVFVSFENRELRLAATDSFRLAEKRIILNSRAEAAGQVLIPFKNALEISKITEDLDQEISVILDKDKISLSGSNFIVTSRVVDGNFPDYQQIIPKKYLLEATVIKQDLANGLKLANVFSNNFQQVTVKVLPSQKKIQLITQNPEIGENLFQLDATFSAKEELEANFNHRYLSDCLQSIDSDSLTLSFAEAGKPLSVKGLSDRSFLYLLMPMNK